jgi:hypothetical protein
MSQAHPTTKTGNPVLDNAGISAIVFATIVLGVFLFMLKQAAESHGEHGAHAGGEHAAAAGSH